MVIALRRPIVNFVFRVTLAFERLAPTAINLYLTRELNVWKEQKLIKDFEVHTKRIHRLHYRVLLDLDMTAMEVQQMLNRLLPEQLGRIEVLRRWFDE
jgi:hypothetical protein